MRQAKSKRGFDKLASAVLALLMVVLPEMLSAGERRGAELDIMRKNGQTVSGELIAVKPNSLLLLSGGKDESVEIVDVASITVFRESREAQGIVYGLLIGAAVGGIAAVAHAGGSQIGQEYLPLYAVYYGVPCALAGALIGGIAAPRTRSKRSIVLTGMPESVVRARMKDLARLARERFAN